MSNKIDVEFLFFVMHVLVLHWKQYPQVNIIYYNIFTHLLTYSLTTLLTYLPTYLLTYQPDASRPCVVSEFRCDNGRCIPLSWVCDGVKDCPNNVDEGTQCNYRITFCRGLYGRFYTLLTSLN